MLDLNALLEEWNKDAPFDETEVMDSIRQVPKLHSKWWNYLAKSKVTAASLVRKYRNMRQVKYRYYNGEFTQEELIHYGWNQYQGPKPLKSQMDEFLENDTDLAEIKDKQEYNAAVIYFLEGVIRSINSRGYDLKTLLEAKKFYNGMN